MKEIELAEYFVNYLSNFDLYFEIPIFQTDIVAKDGNILMSFEVKTTLNFKVIEQAEHATKFFNYSYICVPKSKDMNFQSKICEIFGIGILIYDPNGYRGQITEYQRAKLFRHPKGIKKYILTCLQDYTKKSLPGASGNNGTTITPFKLTIEEIVRYLKRGHNGALLKDVYENVDNHYSSLSGAKSCLYQWIRRGIITQFYIQNSRLWLSENSEID
jgi:hypothetical protein